MVELDILGKRVNHISFTKDDCELWVTGSVITGFNHEEINTLKQWLKDAERMEQDPCDYVTYMINHGQYL